MAAGFVMSSSVGGSLTGLTVTVNVFSTKFVVPPPSSSTRTVMTAVPLALGTGVYFRSLPMTVTEEIRGVLPEVAVMEMIVWSDSLAGPVVMPVSVTVCSPESSSMAAGFVMSSSVGASFTGLTVMFTVSITGREIPEPVFPLSLVTTWIEAAPLKSCVGVKTNPLSVVLMSAIVPDTITKAEALFVMEAGPPTETVPFNAVSVTVTFPEPASISVTEMAFVPDKVSGVSSSMVCDPGTLFVGGSFTAAIITLNVSSTNWPMLSAARTVMLTVPF